MKGNNDKRCVIVAAGEGLPDKRDLCAGLVIAADAGYEKLKAVGVLPDVIIGDFDSADRPDTDLPIITHPCEKDDTDTALACEYAFERGYRDITILCASGGMPDHEYAVYQLLVSLAKRGCKVVMRGKQYDVYAVVGRDRLELEAGYGRVSVFAFSDRAEGVTIKGLKYCVEDHTFTSDRALGVSNERIGKEACVSVEDGVLLVMVQRM